MKPWLKKGLVLLTFLSAFAAFPFAYTSAKEISNNPATTTTIIVNNRDPNYNVPKFIMDVKYNGVMILHYNWTNNIGHSCNAMWINFWDHSELTQDEQKLEGNLGMIWMTKCSNSIGYYNFTIDSKASQKATGIYFEVDNDQMFTGTLQDPIIFTFNFYPFKGQVNFLPTYLPIAFGGVAIIGTISALTLRRREA